ncbi:MAG: hypothetical protein OXN97_22650 [Bryobacterales bacterium]|nr:hypothetical protein [Bryobacterales bacterium]
MAVAGRGRGTPRRELPSGSSLRIEGELLAALGDAEAGLIRLGGATCVSPDRAAFVGMQLRQEAIESCGLDGDRVSLNDLLAMEAAPSSEPARGLQAGRCLQAMRGCLVPSPGGTEPIEGLARIVGILKNGEADAPKARTVLRGVLGLDGDDQGLPDVVRAGLAMGRTEIATQLGPVAGRLIALSLLHRSSGLVVPLSGALGLRLIEYRESLRSVERSGSWRSWILFFLRAVAESADRCVSQIRRASALRDKHVKAVGAGLGYAVGNGLRVLDRMVLDPMASVAEIREITGTSYVAANTLVSRLAELGILHEATGHRRNRSFLYAPYVQVFAGGPDAEDAKRAGPLSPRPRASRPGGRIPPRPRRSADGVPTRKKRPARSEPRKSGGRISDHLL